MARLSQAQWEKARAEYEVTGRSLNEIAKAFGMNVSSVSRKAKAEQWQQGKMQQLVQRKVAAIKDMADIETQKQKQPLTVQKVIDREVAHQVDFDNSLLALGSKIADRTAAMLDAVSELGDAETASRVYRNLKGNANQQTTVNVKQNQEQGLKPLSPAEAVAQILGKD